MHSKSRIDEKEEDSFVQLLPCPFLKISAKDSRGRLIETTQNLSTCAYRGMGILVWGQSYHMQSPLQVIENKTLVEIVLNNYDATTRVSTPVATGQLEIDFGSINSGPVSIYLDKLQPPSSPILRSFGLSTKPNSNSNSKPVKSVSGGGFTLIADISLTQRSLAMLSSTLEEYVVTTYDSSNIPGYNYKVIPSIDRAKDVPFVRFLTKLPRSCVPGEVIKNVGGKRGVTVKVPKGVSGDEVVMIETSIKKVYGRSYFYNDRTDMSGHDGLIDDDRSSRSGTPTKEKFTANPSSRETVKGRSNILSKSGI